PPFGMTRYTLVGLALTPYLPHGFARWFIRRRLPLGSARVGNVSLLRKFQSRFVLRGIQVNRFIPRCKDTSNNVASQLLLLCHAVTPGVGFAVDCVDPQVTDCQFLAVAGQQGYCP